MNRLATWLPTFGAVICALLLAACWTDVLPAVYLGSRHTRCTSSFCVARLGGPATARPSSHWDLLYHLGGNGPWIQKLDDTVQIGIDPPAGCRVDQVHLISRHGERYPTIKVGIRMLDLFHRLKTASTPLNGSLSFVNDWTFFMPEMSTRLENLIPTGPYAGTLDAFSTGTKLRTRYDHLRAQALSLNQTSFFASDSNRVVETARYFASGFFGIDWPDSARLHVIPETDGLGGDTLTPGDTCKNYAENVDSYGHDYGYRMLETFRNTYLPAIAARLNSENVDLNVSVAEVFTMQEMCGFETLALGDSPWCDVFSTTEWESFEYARDLLHFYRAGAGNKYGPTMGWLLLNATKNLLVEGPSAGPLFFSFVHDGDIIPFLAALDLFPQAEPLPADRLLANRTWHTSDVTPMGGRIIIERMTCPAYQECYSSTPLYPNHIYCDAVSDAPFVRININDGILALPGCDSGPGRSCPLEDFSRLVQERGEVLGDFRELCGLDSTAAEGITFLHQ